MSTYNRPGRGVYVTNGEAGTLTHGQSVAIANYVGVAVKQKARAWSDAAAVQAVIDKKEDFFLITKGVVMVPKVEGAVKGDAIYITAATGALTKTEAGNLKYGRVHDKPGERGCPATQMRVDLDQKATL